MYIRLDREETPSKKICLYVIRYACNYHLNWIQVRVVKILHMPRMYCIVAHLVRLISCGSYQLYNGDRHLHHHLQRTLMVHRCVLAYSIIHNSKKHKNNKHKINTDFPCTDNYLNGKLK